MKQILLVEDNADNRDLIFAFLEDIYAVHACADGFQALELLNSDYRPDLILCDISLPGMDGVKFLRTLRAQQHLATLPVIALTSHAMKGDKERFLAAGFEAYVSKPILDDATLLEPIQSLISMTRCKDFRPE